jgi:hypothetical protein
MCATRVLCLQKPYANAPRYVCVGVGVNVCQECAAEHSKLPEVGPEYLKLPEVGPEYLKFPEVGLGT